MPDSHIATKFNLSPVTVLHYRRKLAIPVYTETQMPAWHALVGTMPDVALARQVNVHRDTIANHRRRYDLPAARSL
jgi:DNA-binding CsgD family transcriptional regulator